MDEYFHDARFESKKPKPEGTRKEQCGDNIYYTQGDGQWRRLPSRFHNDCGAFIKDVGKNFEGRPVFVSEHFYYFGNRRVVIPHKLEQVIKDRQGVSYTTGRMAEDFVSWLEANHIPGVRGMPSNMADHAGETGTMLTEWIADCPGEAKNRQRPDCRPKSNLPWKQSSKRGCR